MLHRKVRALVTAASSAARSSPKQPAPDFLFVLPNECPYSVNARVSASLLKLCFESPSLIARFKRPRLIVSVTKMKQPCTAAEVLLPQAILDQ